MAGGGGGLLWLWTEWGTQILVLVSMFLQVVLLIFGEMRLRGLSAWQNVVLWFAYQLADSTAIFTLGHLSITAGGEQGRLAAFWAPFLLLHLGGPHNITAYALEDNRLWLRHLQTLVVQALGAAYVLYKFYHAGSGGALLTLASVSMFVAGLAKYGERTWALRCAYKSCRSSDRMKDNVVNLELELVGESILIVDMDDDEILLRTHSQLPTCRRFLFDDANVKSGLESLGPPRVREKHILKVVEMELSLLYDTLYTKAPVIHTWYGFCIHFISMVGTSTALCLFHLSRGSNNNQGQGYNRADVVISYVLLAGALVLEIISACRALLSTWTCTLVISMALLSACTPLRASVFLGRLFDVLSSLRKHLKLASRRLWRRGTMGQYNLLHLATRDRTDLGSRLAAKLGLEDSWDKLHFSGTFSGTQSLSMRRLKQRLKEVLWRNRFEYRADTRGRLTLEQNGALFNGIAQWAVKDAMFDESIVIWHIATDIFISQYSTANNYHIELVEATRVLSNYMMFLLVAKPNMLPGRERRYVHLNASRELKKCLQDNHVRASSGSWWNKCCILKKLFHHEGPDCSSGIREELAEALRRGWTDNEMFQQTLQAEKIESGSNLETFLRRSSLACAAGLATKPLDLELDRLKTLEVIFDVWVEMMLYAAENCPRDSHARELGNGGELMTIVWLLVKHCNQAARKVGKLVQFDGPRVFTADLLCATAEIMGKSTYGTVYKATLEDGSLVAVKRFREKITKGHREFEAEAAVLGKIRHPNLLALRAYYLGPTGEKLLVFDYMPKGSLSAFLHARAPNTPVDWATRMIIAKGTARGLAYLHDDMSIIHGNLTASNVLLDEQNNPKVSDFGLSRLMTTAAKSNVLAAAGALGYRAPELSKLKKANAKTDVYSLGVIILELLTGKSPSDRTNGMDLPQWVASIVKEEWTSEVFDLELMRDAAAGNVGDELMDTLKLALHCVDPSPSVRPEAREVQRQLEQIRPGPEGGAGPSEEGHVPLIADHQAFLERRMRVVQEFKDTGFVEIEMELFDD